MCSLPLSFILPLSFHPPSLLPSSLSPSILPLSFHPPSHPPSSPQSTLLFTFHPSLSLPPSVSVMPGTYCSCWWELLVTEHTVSWCPPSHSLSLSRSSSVWPYQVLQQSWWDRLLVSFTCGGACMLCTLSNTTLGYSLHVQPGAMYC